MQLCWGERVVFVEYRRFNLGASFRLVGLKFPRSRWVPRELLR